jgi:WD40 repeat protein
MRFWGLFARTAFVVLSIASVDVARSELPPPQKQLKTYILPNNPKSADISPDEHLVVTECITKQEGADSAAKTFVDLVQLWDFKENKLTAKFAAPQSDARTAEQNFFAYSVASGRFVRFTPDGKIVVALIDETIHVLRATDLTELRTIPLARPQPVTQTIRDRTIVSRPNVRAMEVSPDGNVVAVFWLRGMLRGRIQLYDLSSGGSILAWETPSGWMGHTRGLAWHPGGKLLLMAIPNVNPCGSPGSQPDVFAFDVQTGAIKYKLTTGILTGSIAVSSDNRVFAVDLNCMGMFKNHDPKLKVFDLTTGKNLRRISGRESGVRYLVSASADGSRFLAFTGRMRVKFDWGDALPYGVAADETFSAWNLLSYEGIVTSQNIPGLRVSEIRLSSRGNYVVSYGKASFVYELPSQPIAGNGVS